MSTLCSMLTLCLISARLPSIRFRVQDRDPVEMVHLVPHRTVKQTIILPIVMLHDCESLLGVISTAVAGQVCNLLQQGRRRRA